jgi:hypothetical protein
VLGIAIVEKGEIINRGKATNAAVRPVNLGKEKAGTVSRRKRVYLACAQKNDPGQGRDRGALREFLFPNYSELMIRVNPELEG